MWCCRSQSFALDEAQVAAKYNGLTPSQVSVTLPWYRRAAPPWLAPTHSSPYDFVSP